MHRFSPRSRYVVLGSVLAAACIVGPLTEGIHTQVTSGGFTDSATSSGLRSRLSAAEMRAFLPDRGRFTFPAPYSTQGVRLTNASDCGGGGDCVEPVGYSYWSNINSHAGSNTLLVFLGLDRRTGGGGPTLFSYDKLTGATRNVGPLFSPDHPLSWSTGEGWYFSGTQPTVLYLNDGPRIRRYDVTARTLTTVFDAATHFGADKLVWQMHSSHDDRVHSATLRQNGSYEMLGCMVYDEPADRARFFPKRGDFDECQIDRSGRWLVIKENVDGVNGEDNRIIDLQTGTEQLLTDPNGAAGHSDLGFGVMVAEDNYHSRPGAVRLWNLAADMRGGHPASAAGQGVLVYEMTAWSTGVGHIAMGGVRPGAAISTQRACASNASRLDLPRINEIVCFALDGSLNTTIVAPNLSDLNAAGGGADDYSKLPKGNLDVTGEYFIWTANAGANRLDAFIVHVPPPGATGPVGAVASPGDTSGTATGSTPIQPVSAPVTSTPVSTPGMVSSPVSWTSLVNAAASGGSLKKVLGCAGCADAGALSEQRVWRGDGGVSFVARDTQAVRFVGLGGVGSGTSPESIAFAIRLGGGYAEVRESGVYKADVAVAPGDVLRVAVSSGVVRYFKNSTAIYASARRPPYPLAARAALLDRDAAVSNAGFTTTPVLALPTTTTITAAVAWTGLVNTRADAGTLTKTGGCDGCADAAAVSAQRLTGDGSVSVRASDPQGLCFIGLGSGTAAADPMRLQFALRVQRGYVEVRESGEYKADVPIVTGDLLRIAIRGGAVEYSKNGSVFYTSRRAPSYPLVAEAAMLELRSTLSSVLISGS
jgi:hypothetical protein